MPKIRCQSCQTVLNVPDQARGKSVTCPKCKSKIRVPAEKAAAPPRKKGAAPADGNIFGRLDLDSMETEDVDNAICPYCASPLLEDDPVCRSCGMNVETGQMDPKEKKRRAIRGPDPGKFYKAVWSDSWRFVMEEKGLALRTGVYWMLFSSLHALCAYMGCVYCERLPPQVFWIGLAIVTLMGIPGWFLYLGLKVMDATILHNDVRSDRIHFDFFQAIAAGFRTVFWPLIVMGPLTPLAIIAFVFLSLAAESPTVLITATVLWVVIPLLVLPIALAHMTTKYTYKAWILWELLKLLVFNMGAALYTLLVSFVAFLPALIIAVPLFWYLKTVNPFNSPVVNGLTTRIALWLMKLADLGEEPTGAYFAMIVSPLNIAATFLLFAPISLIAGFSGVFVMRAIGLFGYYNQRSLDYVRQIYPGTPATFWVRYLAHTVDGLFTPLTMFLVTANGKALLIQWLVLAVGLVTFLFTPSMLFVWGILWGLYTSWMFWVMQESSQLRSTIGKDAFGLIVVTDDDKMLTVGQASAKWMLRLVFDALAGLPYLTAAFTPQKKAAHDMITKTKVVWKGDK